ncbi:MAG TPA: AAA family ATPase [Polyangia bacterium]|nr:AAA family ATPase [Polyangia bacterium]
MSTLAQSENLPSWASELRRRYLRGEASQFVLHGNVHDLTLYDGKLYTLSEFLSQVLLDRSKDTVALYNLSTGVRFAKRKMKLDGYEDLVLTKEPAKVLPILERALTTEDKLAVILEYADTIAPAGDTSFSTTDDRASAVTLHRWSLLRALERADSIVILTLENLSDLNPRLVSNPRVATVRVPMPDKPERAAAIRNFDAELPDADVERLAEVTAGLKLIQIKAILAPNEENAGDDRDERKRYLIELLSGGAAPSKETLERADKLATITQGMNKEAVRKLIAPDGKAPAPSSDARAEIDKLVAARKREIIERECFGLIEFVTPQHGFEVVGGLDEVKKDLLAVAENIRAGRRNRCPMGILFTGPMGTGKTFVAEAFAKECGLTTIKLKNFRSKWVGATEGNLEKILGVIQAIGQIIVIIDEGDRAFGSGGDGDGDGGTSSRVIGRIKEFMSDTENRGRVLFILMTNRPDKLDVDIKRAGRLDRKIPFLYPQTPEEVEDVLVAQLRKHKVKAELKFPNDRALSSPLVGYSNAELEAIVMLSSDYAAERSPDAAVSGDDFTRATRDYLPSRDVVMLEYMELLAVFEASNRRMLPRKYADTPVEELQAKLGLLRAQVGGRR